MIRRWTSSPSSPPSRATRGSWSRASGGMVGDRLGRHVRRVGDQHVHPPAQASGSAAYRSPSKTWSAGEVPPRARHARPGPRPRRTPRTPGTSASTAAPTAPDPQHRSTTTGACPDSPRRLGWVSRLDQQPKRLGLSTATATSRPVRRRGTKTPGVTATRRPQNSAQPRRCSRGTPAQRRATRSSRSAGEEAAATQEGGLLLGEHASRRRAAERSTTRSVGSGSGLGLGRLVGGTAGAPASAGRGRPRRWRATSSARSSSGATGWARCRRRRWCTATRCTRRAGSARGRRPASPARAATRRSAGRPRWRPWWRRAGGGRRGRGRRSAA